MCSKSNEKSQKLSLLAEMAKNQPSISVCLKVYLKKKKKKKKKKMITFLLCCYIVVNGQPAYAKFINW